MTGGAYRRRDSLVARQAERWRAHLRLTILRVLASTQGGSANDSLLTGAVRDTGIDADRDQVIEQLDWLAGRKCVKVERIEPLRIASLTDLGELVAEGRRRIEGVQPPSRR